MITCIALDDEPLALEVMEAFCTRTKNLELKRTFTDSTEAARYLKKYPVDLLLLDIQMPDMSGLDFYKNYGADKMVIFLTAHSEYAVEGFNVNALDYLLKPVEFSRFEIAINKAVDYNQYLHSTPSLNQRHLFVRSEYSLIKIAFSEIEYIETLDDYIKIHVEGRKPVLTKMNLKNVLERLDHKEFVRVHRSFIVALTKIISVRNKTILLRSAEIPIGLKFESDFLKIYSAG